MSLKLAKMFARQISTRSPGRFLRKSNKFFTLALMEKSKKSQKNIEKVPSKKPLFDQTNTSTGINSQDHSRKICRIFPVPIICNVQKKINKCSFSLSSGEHSYKRGNSGIDQRALVYLYTVLLTDCLEAMPAPSSSLSRSRTHPNFCFFFF